MKTNKILAWHFVSNDKCLRYGSRLEVAPGYIYSETGKTILCEHGMHASKRVYDALNYAPGNILCRVRLWGGVRESSDKLVAQHREVLAMTDVFSELRSWAFWCVRNTPLSGGRTTWDLLTDERSRRAVEVAELFSLGQASTDEMSAAWDAAGSKAWSKAWDAARDAAGNSQATELERRMLALFGEASHE